MSAGEKSCVFPTTKHFFQIEYSKKIAADRDLAEFGVKDQQAIFASLSHGHLNCVVRNIQAGVRGCECIQFTVVGEKDYFTCTCKAKPILDENGDYSMALVAGRGKEWHSDIFVVWSGKS